jgi:hypothetical protein
MDPTRFDHLAKLLADSRSRRGLLAGALGVPAGILGAQAGKARRKRRRTKDRNRTQTRNTKRRVKASANTCRAAGRPCEGNQTCCPGFGCIASGPGGARRCTPCSSEGDPCVGHEECCGGACCRIEGIDPVGVCCGSRDRCCGSACCTGELVCDFRFEMCVRCSKEGEFCQIPSIFCCPGLGLICDVDLAQCVPEP